jgi:hypothetical protein
MKSSLLTLIIVLEFISSTSAWSGLFSPFTMIHNIIFGSSGSKCNQTQSYELQNELELCQLNCAANLNVSNRQIRFLEVSNERKMTEITSIKEERMKDKKEIKELKDERTIDQKKNQQLEKETKQLKESQTVDQKKIAQLEKEVKELKQERTIDKKEKEE